MTLLKISAADVLKLRRRILSWFAERKRDLPWRRTRDPYRIWLSEIMLQQTRVAAVVPYYERFLQNFPGVRTLARANTDRVLACWAGLGYYSRARNLQRAAQEIVSKHSGEFPREYEDALALPGVGRYTAAAVLSIAFGAPRAVLDGNVARVLARMGALRRDLRAPAVWRTLEATAHELLERKSPGDWNQAMMELGATLCTPKSPRCEECPVRKWCRAHALGIAEKLPSARKKQSTVDVTLAAAVLLDSRGRTLLVRRADGDGAVFSRLWQFPALDTTGKDAGAALSAHLRENFGVTEPCRLTPLASARHAVTFRSIHLRPFLVRVGRLPRISGGRAVALGKIRGLPISNATQKVLRAVLEREIR